jgi:hypothetical protein
MAETRLYPMSCRSLYCGETDSDSAACRNCPSRPELDAFNEWRQQQSAIQPDPIWSPAAWRSAAADC